MPRVPEELNLAEVTQEAIRAQRKHLRDRVASRDPKSRRYKTDEMASSEQVDSAQRALAGLIKEARSLSKDATSWASKLSVEEKRSAIVDWFGSLPRQQQTLLVQELMRTLNGERTAA